MQCDIAIVGGGMAGLTMAAMLAKQKQMSVMLFDAKPKRSHFHASFQDHRVSAFSLSSQRIFKSLNLWEKMSKERVSPFERIEVWDQSRNGHITFDSTEINERFFGFIIENKLVESVLHDHLETTDVKIKTHVELQTLDDHDDAMHLTLSDGTFVKARLVIAADGANSLIRELAKIKVTTYDYQQKGLVATVSHEKPHDRIASQYFLATGPLAFLPLQNPHESSIVWTLPNELADEYQHLSQDEFKSYLETLRDGRIKKQCDLLRANGDKELGKIVEVSERFLFPFVYRNARQYVKNRVVLIGDAAHTIHPMAGQGINMGLLDVLKLVEVLSACQFDLSQRIHRTLRQYERARMTENSLMLDGVHYLQRLFSTEMKLIKRLTSVGLNMTNGCGWLKAMFATRASL